MRSNVLAATLALSSRICRQHSSFGVQLSCRPVLLDVQLRTASGLSLESGSCICGPLAVRVRPEICQPMLTGVSELP
jgi:hypothetical protein